MTEADFSEFIKNISNSHTPREMVIYTGIKGHEEIEYHMKVDSLNMRLNQLNLTKKVTEEEFDRIKEILYSPDRSNFAVAEAIIEFREKELLSTRIVVKDPTKIAKLVCHV